MFKKVKKFNGMFPTKNKYGTRTEVAELMCDQLGGDCSKENDHSKGGYRPRNGNHLREGGKQTGE